MIKNLPNPRCCNTDDVRHLCDNCAAAYNASHQQPGSTRNFAANASDDDEFDDDFDDDDEDLDEEFDEEMEELSENFRDSEGYLPAPEPLVGSVENSHFVTRLRHRILTLPARRRRNDDDKLPLPDTMGDILAMNAAECRSAPQQERNSAPTPVSNDGAWMPPMF
ncbi:MAG TPA: hypothetical protein VFG20_13705 [Planctomycetaceae bacterium]|nr:hypothetical protein [Planctomycetaceae bacterium]